MTSSLRVSSIRISTISHATEDSGKVVRAMQNLWSNEAPPEIVRKRVKGHHGNEIVILESVSNDSKLADHFLRQLWMKISALDKVEIGSSLAARVDSSGTLHLRLDKQAAFQDILRIQDVDPIKIEISFRGTTSAETKFSGEIRELLKELQTR